MFGSVGSAHGGGGVGQSACELGSHGGGFGGPQSWLVAGSQSGGGGQSVEPGSQLGGCWQSGELGSHFGGGCGQSAVLGSHGGGGCGQSVDAGSHFGGPSPRPPRSNGSVGAQTLNVMSAADPSTIRVTPVVDSASSRYVPAGNAIVNEPSLRTRPAVTTLPSEIARTATAPVVERLPVKTCVDVVPPQPAAAHHAAKNHLLVARFIRAPVWVSAHSCPGPADPSPKSTAPGSPRKTPATSCHRETEIELRESHEK